MLVLIYPVKSFNRCLFVCLFVFLWLFFYDTLFSLRKRKLPPTVSLPKRSEKIDFIDLMWFFPMKTSKLSLKGLNTRLRSKGAQWPMATNIWFWATEKIIMNWLNDWLIVWETNRLCYTVYPKGGCQFVIIVILRTSFLTEMRLPLMSDL